MIVVLQVRMLDIAYHRAKNTNTKVSEGGFIFFSWTFWIATYCIPEQLYDRDMIASNRINHFMDTAYQTGMYLLNRSTRLKEGVSNYGETHAPEKVCL